MRRLPIEITDQIARIESDINAANTQELLILQPKFHKFLRDLGCDGYDIPMRLRNLDMDLENDAVEAQFDNLPL